MESMQKRFHELGRQAAEIEASLKPLQDQYDALRQKQNDIDKQLEPIREELRAKKAPLGVIYNERGAIARALNGQTGKP